MRPRAKGKDGRGFGPRELLDKLGGAWACDRHHFIVFDSDAATKKQVQLAEKCLKNALKGLGLSVSVVRLPRGPGGAKQGLDDFLARHGRAGLLRLLRLLRASSHRAADYAGGRPAWFQRRCDRGPTIHMQKYDAAELAEYRDAVRTLEELGELAPMMGLGDGVLDIKLPTLRPILHRVADVVCGCWSCPHCSFILRLRHSDLAADNFRGCGKIHVAEMSAAEWATVQHRVHKWGGETGTVTLPTGRVLAFSSVGMNSPWCKLLAAEEAMTPDDAAFRFREVVCELPLPGRARDDDGRPTGEQTRLVNWSDGWREQKDGGKCWSMVCVLKAKARAVAAELRAAGVQMAPPAWSENPKSKMKLLKDVDDPHREAEQRHGFIDAYDGVIPGEEFAGWTAVARAEARALARAGPPRPCEPLER
jgi:hypothetical protein